MKVITVIIMWGITFHSLMEIHDWFGEQLKQFAVTAPRMITVRVTCRDEQSFFSTLI